MAMAIEPMAHRVSGSAPNMADTSGKTSAKQPNVSMTDARPDRRIPVVTSSFTLSVSLRPAAMDIRVNSAVTRLTVMRECGRVNSRNA